MRSVLTFLARLRQLLLEAGQLVAGAGDTDETADFKNECIVRMAAGWAFLGKKFDETKKEYVDLNPTESTSDFLQDKLKKMPFPIVSESTLMKSQAALMIELQKVRSVMTVEEVETISKGIDRQKEFLQEMYNGIKIGSQDLKKAAIRIEKDKKKNEAKERTKKEAEEKEKNEQALQEYKRALQLSQLSVPFQISADMFVVWSHLFFSSVSSTPA